MTTCNVTVTLRNGPTVPYPTVPHRTPHKRTREHLPAVGVLSTGAFVAGESTHHLWRTPHVWTTSRRQVAWRGRTK